MVFKYEKFKEGARSSAYSDWEQSLVEICKKAGGLPTKNSIVSEEYEFTLHIPRVPSKQGRYRSSFMVDIICPKNGNISIVQKCRNKAYDPSDIKRCSEVIANFFVVMTENGYIKES